MDWTLSDIKAKVRALTGRPSTSQLSDAALLNHINQYYRNVLYLEVGGAAHLQGSTAFFTADGTGEYALSSSILKVMPPVTISNPAAIVPVVNQIPLYVDHNYFFGSLYPDGSHDEADEEAEPTGMLFWNRTLYLRPVPDTVYTVSYYYVVRPAAFAIDADAPLDVMWGPLIAYGASIEIFNEAGEQEQAAQIVPMYEAHKTLIARRNIYQMPDGMRAAPAF